MRQQNWPLTLFRLLLVLLALPFCIILIRNLVVQLEIFQWDFRTYYFASKAYLAGGNPYDTEFLARFAGRFIELPYVYPPLTLLFFTPFLIFSYPVAFYLYLGLKCLVLLFLFYLWQRAMGRPVGGLFYAFCFLAFNATIYMDFRAGNVSLFEQLLLWLAFISLLRGSLSWFCGLVVTAATFKMTPILFLSLLWFSNHPRRNRYLAVSAAVFLTFLVLSVLVNPGLSAEYLENLRVLSEKEDERGRINPSTLALFNDVRFWFRIQEGVDVGRLPVVLAYLALAALIVVVSVGALRVLRQAGSETGLRWMVFFTCVTYAILLPRFKDYSFLLLLAPAYFILKREAGFRGDLQLLLFTLVSTPDLIPGLSQVSPFMEYGPLGAAYGAWGLYLWAIFSTPAGGKAAEAPS